MIIAEIYVFNYQLMIVETYVAYLTIYYVNFVSSIKTVGKAMKMMLKSSKVEFLTYPLYYTLQSTPTHTYISHICVLFIRGGEVGGGKVFGIQSSVKVIVISHKDCGRDKRCMYVNVRFVSQSI